ncbi:MAG: PEP-utilizing enzyme [Deltaproteobacteria bacterium]|nr:PEP-utilizing enzyme [Deltaproteobacteria bacterium]
MRSPADAGFLARSDYEFAAPRADEDPSILETAAVPDAPETAPPDTAFLDELRERQKDTFIPWMPWLAKRWGNAYRRLMLSAEERHLVILKIAANIRRAAIERARALGVPAADAFFATWDELDGGTVASADVLAARRAAYERALSDAPPVAWRAIDGRLERIDAARDGERAGLGIGTGIVRGVVITPDQTMDASDAVILLPNTATHWAGILARGLPILAASGGVLSHLATMARDMRVPFFVLSGGTPPEPGTPVTIDFERGVVRDG